MFTFRRQVTIADVAEAQILCKLIEDSVPHTDFYEIAQAFGCEFTCDDQGEMIDPDFSPMIGEWFCHFEYCIDRVSSDGLAITVRIHEEVQSAAEIDAEYRGAVALVREHVAIQEEAKKAATIAPVDMDKLNKWFDLDDKLFWEMDKRRDLAVGSPNRYTDYSGLEEYYKWLN